MRKQMTRKTGGFFLALFLAAAGCGACGAKNELPDVSGLGEAVIISREEGSGTRAEFEKQLGTDAAATDQIAASTEEVFRLVGADPAAVGYAAFSAADTVENVRVLRIDGVAPSEDTVGKGKYPLCRSYYLAYNGELRDVETDFLAYVTGAGQEIVAGSCLAVKKPGTFLSDKSAGTIRIEGSSSIAPLLEELAAEYETYNPNAEIEVVSTDSSAGLTAAIRGECDLAMSSRSLESYEDELLEKTEIGRDAIVLLVNAENPVENLTKKQIRGLYDGDCAAWSDVR